MDTRLLIVERMFDDGDLPSADDIRAAACARVGRTEGESEKLRAPSLLSIRIEMLIRVLAYQQGNIAHHRLHQLVVGRSEMFCTVALVSARHAVR